MTTPDLAPLLAGTQRSLDEIGEPLSATTFVVVDLETTGGSPETSAITEIGAVKTCGGEVVGEFQTLVDPGGPIPPMIIALTGITDAMVMAAPRIEQVLPAFLEFLGDAVLVAHNARFDVGFLKAACRAHQYAWPGNEAVDTLVLARRATTKEEAPNKKLGTLARVFGTQVTPNHRALEDARATSEVLHGMLERLARFGITHREDLDSLRNPMPESLRKKATLADKVPSKPGVYVFRGPRGERLYVGTSKNLRSRVKSYFTRGEQRRQIREMLELAVDVDTLVCATEIEANVREVRLIEEHRPRYNRRSARPERTPWVKLTVEPYPRLAVSRSIAGADAALGPMRGAGDARAAIEVLQTALSLRTCTTRLPIVPRPHARACLLKDLGQCSAPCVRGEEADYSSAVDSAVAAMNGDPSPVVDALSAEIAAHAERLDFERAAELRDGVSALIEASMRSQRLASLRRVSLVAARAQGDGWDLVSVTDGLLAGSEHVTEGVWEAADRLRNRWSTLDVAEPLIEEQEMLARWLERPGTRLLHIDGDWSQPIAGAGRHASWVQARRDDHASVVNTRGATSGY
ncbi:DEDD exonuclease domain-containing protein [Demequina zhanjiangensis]|uniref:DEDD exonuclease domain-containing protein n=1 Tax=Demequina zhanjiangensis TaxID=3051659 RepID=A0ABT8G0N0_9MICO|nr:DEDD exonuclease domain-containing protein [Demequina sp. SYSU T00b26]MDN4472690.1 DEDD exonuclease domain-containing protein [Demequina sp. SYSU T00b26]